MAQNNKINFQIDFKKGDVTALNSLKKDIAEIQRLAGDIDFTGDMNPTEIQNMIKAAKTLETSLDKAFDVNLNTVNVQKFNNLLRQSGYNAETLQADLASAGITGQQAFLKATGQLMQFNTATKQTNKFLDDIATSLGNTIKWSIMSSIVNNISSTIQKSYYYVKDLDSALNDIRIVTGKSADEMSRFAESANNAAKSLAVTTEDYTQGSLIYYQQGLDDETVKTLTDITAMTSNVTGQAMSTVSEQLTAVWNGYQVANRAATEGMQVYEEYVDKLAAVGATTASDLEELSTAMSKVASAASSMGVGFDDLNAQIATIVSVTRQAPESVGTALKTIYARLGDLKVDGVDEFGTKLGEVSSQLQTMGINILDTNGDMRDMTSVMAEVAQKWDEWTSAQRQAAAIAMAGKRQYNNLVALFDNWDMYGEALETSMEAAGTLQEQQAIAMDSLANKMDVLKSTAEDLYDSLFNVDIITNWVEKGTDILQFLADFSDAVGGLNNLLPMLGSLGLQVFSEQIGRGLSTIVINARNAIQQTQMMKDNFEQIKLMFADSSLFGTAQNDIQTDIMTQSVQELKQYYEEMYQYQKLMTQEQKEQYNQVLKAKVEAGELKLKIAEEVELWKQKTEYVDYIDSSILNDLNNVEKITKEQEKINNLIKESNNFLEVNEDNIRLGLGNFKGDINVLHQYYNILKEILGITDDLDPRLQSLKDTMNSVGKGMTASDKIRELIKVLEGFDNGINEVNKLNNTLKNTEIGARSLGKALKEDMSIQAFATNMSKAAGAVGQLASSFSTLKNIGSIIDDDSIDSTEKLLRIITNISFTVPMVAASIPNLIEGFKSLKKGIQSISTTYEALNGVKKASIVIDEAVNATHLTTLKGLEKENAAYILNIKEKILNNEITDEATLKQNLKNYAESKGITVESLHQKELLALIGAKKAEAAVTEEDTIAQEANTAAKYAAITATVALVAVLGLLAVGIAKVVAAEGERRVAAIKARAEEQKAFEEAHEARRKEIKEEQELAQSYIDLYNKYKEGNIEKEAMVNKTNSLVDILGAEAVAVANLIGDYEALNEQLLQYRTNKIGEKIQQNTEEIENERNKIRTVQDEGGVFAQVFDQHFIDTLTDSEKELFKLVDGYGSNYNLDLSKDFSGEDFYNVIKKLQESGYVNAEDISSVINPIVNILNAEKENEILEISKKLAEENKVSEINNYEDFNQLLNNIIDELGNTKQYQGKDYQAKFDKAIEIISKLGGNEEDVLRAQATNSLVQKYGEDKAKEVTNKIQNLSSKDLSILLGMDLDWDNFNNNLNEILHDGQLVADHNAIDVRIDAINSIKEGIASGEIKEEARQELQETFSSLDINWEEFWNNFDASTPLEQVNQLNELIEKTNDNIYNTDKAIEGIDEDTFKKDLEETKKELEIALEYQEQLKRQSANSGNIFQSEELEKTTQKVEELTKKLNELEAKEAYTIEIDYNDTALDLFTNNVNGILSMAENAKSAAELIGEGFIVAAEDAEELFKVYPALQDAAEVLANGDIQLNQQVVDTILSGNMDIIESNTEVADQQLQQQIDMLQAQIDYNKSKMKALSDYLAGEKTAQETEDAINEAGAQYEKNLQDAVGKNAVENTGISMTANNELTDGVLNNLDKIGERANALGQALARALAGEAANYTPGGGGNAGGSVSDYSNYTTTAVDKVRKENNDYAAKAEAEMQRLMSETTDLTKQLANAQLLQSKLRAGSKESLDSLRGAASGKGGKIDKDKSGGSKDKQKELKELDEEFDRYWQIKKAIDMVDLSIKRLEKDQKNLHGQELIDSLKKENELLAEQKANYEALYKMQQEEQAELQAKLAGSGVIFDASGAITNYAQATTAALAQYTAAVNAYNAGLIDDTAFEVQEKAYENFKKTLERYEALYYKEMQDTQDKIDDARRKQLENNLKAWETEIQIKLDLQEAERQWADFLKNITEDFQSVFKDLTVDMDTLLAKSKTYTGKNGKDGTIGADIAAIQDVMREIDKMRNGEESSMFESISQAQEKLKELQEKLQKDAQALRDLWKEGWELYLKQIDQVADKFEALQKRFNDINNQIKFYADYVKLVFGDKAYKTLDKIYKAQEKATKNQLEAAKREADMWKEEFDKSGADINNPLEWTEDQKKFYENWINAQENVNDLALDYVKILQEDYVNTIEDIYDALEKSLYGMSLDDIAEEWERISYYSDHYLDNIEKSYETQKLANKIDQDIASTSNLRTQQKLQEFRDKYITQLRERKEITQYELDATEAKYQIMLKEAALEDAMNNKTTMKMTRNEQGNWSYQYVADEDDAANKRQELLDTYNDLYQLATKAFQENLEASQRLAQEYQEKGKEISENVYLTEEEKNQKLLELQTWYEEESARLVQQNQIIKNDLRTAGAGLVMEIYEQDEEAARGMTDNEIAMVEELKDAGVTNFMELENSIVTNYKNIGDTSSQMMADTQREWIATANNIIDAWSKDDGKSVKAKLTEATKKVQKAFEEYQEKVKKCSDLIDFDLDDLDSKLNQLTNDTDKLKDKTNELADESTNDLDKMREAVEALRDAWESVQNQIMDTINKLKEYINLQAKANGGGGNTNTGGPNNSSNGPGTPNSNSGDGDNKNNTSGGKKTYATDDGYNYYNDPNGVHNTLGITKNGILQEIIGYDGSEAGRKSVLNAWAQKPPRKYTKFDSSYLSGGYTGDWGTSNGRPAILHQKELVLNKQDTSNFLQGISLLRDMTALNGSISGAISNAVMGMALSLSGITPSSYSGSSTTETNNGGDIFNITAEFPNANDVNEIREAILSLPRLASQYIGRNLK